MGSEVFSEPIHCVLILRKKGYILKVMYGHFGFTDHIFNTKPLELCQGDLHKFIGRVQDIKSFVVDLSQDSASLIVTGHRGVGKTSFVNVLEYAVGFDQNFLQRHIKTHIPNLIPCYYKIQIEPQDHVRDILTKSLSSLLFSINQFAKEKRAAKKIPKQIADMTNWIAELTYSATKLHSVNISGFGGGFSQTTQHKSLSEFPTNVLQDKIVQTVKSAKKAFNVDGLLLNINNVDILEEKKTCDIFNRLRDYLFNIPGLWNIVIGPPGLYSSLYQQATRVAEVISGQETKLDPLSEEDIIAVLKTRQKLYAQNPKKLSPLPIEEGFIRELYKNSDGEIRTVFKACDDIVRLMFKDNPNTRLLKPERGRLFLKYILENQLALSHLKTKEKQIIASIFENGSLRPKDYKTLKLKSSVEFTNRTRPLLLKNFLKKEVKGNVANYKVTGVIHLAKYAHVKI